MENAKEEYIRVGTTLYKIAKQPLANGTTVLRRIPWSFGTIRQDYGKNQIPPIKKIRWLLYRAKPHRLSQGDRWLL